MSCGSDGIGSNKSCPIEFGPRGRAAKIYMLTILHKGDAGSDVSEIEKLDATTRWLQFKDKGHVGFSCPGMAHHCLLAQLGWNRGCGLAIQRFVIGQIF